MQLTNQTVGVSKIAYRLNWANTPSSDTGTGYLDIPIGGGPNFLDIADDFATAWAADYMSAITHTSYVLVRAFLGSFETTEVTVP